MSQTTQADALPTPQYTQTRSSPRAFVILPATISFGSDGAHRAGLTRDISQTGIFFYCDVKPELESEVNVVVRVGQSAAIAYKGVVVRVEEPSAGAAVGVAIRILHTNESSVV
jgi:hypothetical protein